MPFDFINNLQLRSIYLFMHLTCKCKAQIQHIAYHTGGLTGHLDLLSSPEMNILQSFSMNSY